MTKTTRPDTHGMKLGRASRLLVAAVAALVIAACSSTVTRTPAAGSTPRYGATTVVRKGDTLYRIATENGIAVRDLAEWNRLAPPYTIYPGQRLSLYPGNGASTPSRSTATTTPPPRDTAPSRTTTPPPVAAPVRSGIDWKWPVDGALLSRFEAGEPTKQGIDIAGTGGTPVRSAADGTVVYSGSGLVGYGELIIIKHNEQWLSAYGHNRTRLVAEGAVVKAGQQIAELGRTGASRDQLHFEIRHNGKPVDPLLYLPRK